MSLPGLVFLLVVVAALERFGMWAGRRSWLPWRRSGTPMASAGFTELDAFMEAGRRHEIERRNHALMVRQTQEEGAPPLVEVDLDAGRFVLRGRLPDR